MTLFATNGNRETAVGNNDNNCGCPSSSSSCEKLVIDIGGTRSPPPHEELTDPLANSRYYCRDHSRYPVYVEHPWIFSFRAAVSLRHNEERSNREGVRPRLPSVSPKKRFFHSISGSDGLT